MQTQNKYKDLIHELSEFCKINKIPLSQVGYLTGLFVKHEQKLKATDIHDFSEWRFLANEKPSKEGNYEVIDNKGQVEILIYGCSGFIGETVGFFNGKKVNAQNIIAFR